MFSRVRSEESPVGWYCCSGSASTGGRGWVFSWKVQFWNVQPLKLGISKTGLSGMEGVGFVFWTASITDCFLFARLWWVRCTIFLSHFGGEFAQPLAEHRLVFQDKDVIWHLIIWNTVVSFSPPLRKKDTFLSVAECVSRKNASKFFKIRYIKIDWDDSLLNTGIASPFWSYNFQENAFKACRAI